MEELASGWPPPEPAVATTAVAASGSVTDVERDRSEHHAEQVTGTTRITFDTFVVGRTDRLLRTAYLLTRDHALAEDLLQTALTKAWTAWRRIEADPEPYVRKILVNTYATWWRRKWTGERPTEVLPETVASNEIEAQAERRDLWTALGRLPRRQQAAVVLRYYEGLSEAETAEVLGCTVGTVKSSTSRALAKLRIDPALDLTSGDHR
jgi:RNA polymerase sigma-70 factor (sigma-E family)